MQNLLTIMFAALLGGALQAKDIAKSTSLPPEGPSVIGFGSTNYYVAEGNSVQISIQRTGNWAEEQSVDLEVRTVDASGQDFSFPATRIYFRAGDSHLEQHINFQSFADSLFEDTETVQLVLVNNVGGDLGNSTATVGILDLSRGQILLTRGTNDCVEADGKAQVHLDRLNGTSGSVTVTWRTVENYAQGYASNTQDYHAASGTVIFEEGQTTASFEIPILHDAKIEGDELIEIHLSDEFGGALTATPAGFVRITDSAVPTTSKLVGSFNSGVGPNGAIREQFLLPNGTTIVRGDFTSYDGTSRNGLARVLTNGNLDETFSPSLVAQPHAIAVDLDGKIVGAAGADFFRLNHDGGMDLFTPPDFGLVEAIAALPNGKLLVVGWLAVGNSYELSLVQLNSEGALDETFPRQSFSPASDIRAIVLAGESIYLTGRVVTPNSIYRLLRFSLNGEWDINFNPAFDGEVSAVATTNDYVYVGGSFQKNLVRLNAANGVEDTSFAPSVDGAVHAIFLKNNSDIVIGGAFQNIGTNSALHLAKISSSGDFAGTFGSGTDGNVFSIVTTPAGELQIGGAFKFVDGAGRNYLARLATPPIPQLSIRPSGDGRLKISWPVGCGNFVLEKSQTPGDEGWNTVDTTSSRENDREVVYQPINGPINFYRLRR